MLREGGEVCSRAGAAASAAAEAAGAYTIRPSTLAGTQVGGRGTDGTTAAAAAAFAAFASSFVGAAAAAAAAADGGTAGAAADCVPLPAAPGAAGHAQAHAQAQGTEQYCGVDLPAPTAPAAAGVDGAATIGGTAGAVIILDFLLRFSESVDSQNVWRIASHLGYPIHSFIRTCLSDPKIIIQKMVENPYTKRKLYCFIPGTQYIALHEMDVLSKLDKFLIASSAGGLHWTKDIGCIPLMAKLYDR